MLESRGLERRVAVLVSTFLMVPHVLVGTRRIATVPIAMAERLVREHPLRRIDPPLAVPGFTLCQAWHEILRDDPGHRWLRARLAELAGQIGSKGVPRTARRSAP